MFTLDFSFLGQVVLGFLTLAGGLFAGWLAHGIAKPSPPASTTPGTPGSDPAAEPLSLMDAIARQLAEAGSNLTFPGADNHVAKLQIFHTLAHSFLALPIPPGTKAKAIQDLVGFIDGLFDHPPAPVPKTT